jgi:hypothetical protein
MHPVAWQVVRIVAPNHATRGDRLVRDDQRGGRSDEVRTPADGSSPAVRRPRAPSAAGVFWASFLFIAVTATLHVTYLFSTPIHEQADEALNSLLVNRAEHFQQLEGNYSRVGFHHPGPAFLYVLAAGQTFFHGILHAVPTPYNGQLLGSLLFVAVLIALAVTVIYRCVGSTLAAGVACGAIYLFAAHHSMLGVAWFPFLYMAPYLLFLVTGAALAAGATRELPLFVLSAGFLAHGHVSFLMFVSVTTVAVGACWLMRHRTGLRAELNLHRRATISSLILLALFALPVVLQIVLHYPGPWGKYLLYVHNGNAVPRTARDVARFFGWYWSHSAPLGLIVGAVVVAGILMIGEHNPFYGYLYGLLALQSVLTVYYVARGVDLLAEVNRYVGFFYLTVPLLLIVTAAVQLTVRLTALRPLESTVALAAVAVVVLVLAALTSEPKDKNRNRIAYQQLAAALANDPARSGRVVALDFRHDQWSNAAGLGIAAERRRLPWCVRNPRWANMFTSRYICRSDEQQWTLVVVPTRDVPAAATVVWQDRRLAVIERDPSAPLLPANP